MSKEHADAFECGYQMGLAHGRAEHESIVRCRDCAKAEFPEVHLLNGMKRHILTCVRFQSFQHETQPDGFCAWACRKEQ